MNSEILKSKKFRAALLAAVSAILTYGVAKFNWDLDPTEVIALLTAISGPFLFYIGAEGYSEAGAKKVIEENKVRENLADKVLDQIITDNYIKQQKEE